MSSSAAARVRHGAERSEPLRVLLIEDSELDAELITNRLEEAGLEVAVTRVDTHDAFNQALSHCPFDLILSDYKLPGFDGMIALSAAQLACPELPFLFVSGALGEDKAIELLKRGATDYVLKDRLERLVPSVERALREAEERGELKRAEKKLRERERTLSTLMANLPGMAFRCSPSPPWHFEFASEGARAISGYRPEAFYAGGERTWASIMHPDDVQRVIAEADVAFGERRQLTTTYRIRTARGEERWVWDRSMAQYRSDGSLEAIEGFVIDVTAQRQAEEEVKRRGEFEQQLIGIVSHDLRNPLNVIVLGASMLVRQQGLDDRSTNTARRILSSAERATRMIRDLLDFTQARLGGGIPVERKRLDLYFHAALVTEELESLHSERSIELSRDGDTEGDWDPGRIEQIVGNLVGNALAYSPRDTKVSVRVRGEERWVLLEVHNWGEPIPAERLPQLFQPFSRGVGKPELQSRSIGLGLYIVENVVRAHGGQVEATSSKEAGTTFTVRLARQTDR